MNKFKLISALSGTAILSVVPLVTTACDNGSKPSPEPEPEDKRNYIVYDGQTEYFDFTFDQRDIDFLGVSNSKFYIKGKECNVASLSEIYIKNTEGVTAIPNSFLSGCTHLTTINLSGLNNIKTIGDSFLQNCSGLEKLDMSTIGNVETVGNSFLSGCSRLSNLNINSLKKVKSINQSFLSGCTSLEQIDLSGLMSCLLVHIVWMVVAN